MELDLNPLRSPQLSLFSKPTEVEERTLIPLIWRLLEALLSKESDIKLFALQELANLNAIMVSPIIVAILVSSLEDRDEAIRKEIVDIIGNFLKSPILNDQFNIYIRAFIKDVLSRMRTRSIYSLIQLYNLDVQLKENIVTLINQCPNAGKHLTDIFLSRNSSIKIRQNAIEIIGIIGYINAIPDMERLLSRLLTRINGQQSMPFITSQGLDETPLIHYLEASLTNLKAM
jgi:hypothetical protein